MTDPRKQQIDVRIQDKFECADGHTRPTFGCVECMAICRGVESWRCFCGDDQLPTTTRCKVCGRRRPVRFKHGNATINRVDAHRAQKKLEGL
jgi:hypothetical protein